MEDVFGLLICLVFMGGAGVIGLVTTILAIYYGYTKSGDETTNENKLTLKDQTEIN